MLCLMGGEGRLGEGILTFSEKENKLSKSHSSQGNLISESIKILHPGAKKLKNMQTCRELLTQKKAFSHNTHKFRLGSPVQRMENNFLLPFFNMIPIKIWTKTSLPNLVTSGYLQEAADSSLPASLGPSRWCQCPMPYPGARPHNQLPMDSFPPHDRY